MRLVLDGATITSPTSAAISATSAAKLVLLTTSGSSNQLTDAATGTQDAALYSAVNTTIGGQGTLTVNGRLGDAIGVKGGLVIADGTLNVTAADDGIRGKDYLVVRGGAITVDSAADALKSTNDSKAERGYVLISGGTFQLDADTDGIQAETDLIITGGTLSITTAGGAAHAASLGADVSAKALKSEVLTVIEGGRVTADAAEDGIHTNGEAYINGGRIAIAAGDDGAHADIRLEISGGQLTISRSEEGLEAAVVAISGGTVNVAANDDGINAASDTIAAASLAIQITGGSVAVNAQGDGIDSNGALTISGGVVAVDGPTGNGDAALDSDGTMQINGGVVLAVGSSGMVQTPASSSQSGWLAGTFSTQAAGTIISVSTEGGQWLASYVTKKQFAAVIFASPDVTNGSRYVVRSGATVTCTTTGGLAAEGTIGATTLATVTAGQRSTSGPGGGGPGTGTGGSTAPKATATITASAPTVSFGKATVVKIKVSAVGTASAGLTNAGTVPTATTVPTGTVTVTSASSSASAPLAHGAATIALPTKLTAGRHAIKITYRGDSAVASATTSLTATVKKASVKARVKVAKESIAAGKKVKVTIRLTSATGATPSGRVTISLGGKKIRTVKIGATGKRTVRVTVPASTGSGAKALRVRFQGSTNFKASASGAKTAKARVSIRSRTS